MQVHGNSGSPVGGYRPGCCQLLAWGLINCICIICRTRAGYYGNISQGRVHGMQLPYFAMYPRDWMSDPRVQIMDLREEGAYFRLLLLCWTYDDTCTLPDDDHLLARLLGIAEEEWLQLRQVLVEGEQAVFQHNEEGRLYNRRLMREWKNAMDRSEKARKAAQSRWASDGNADAMRTHSDGNADAMHGQCHTEAEAEAYTDTDTEVCKDTRVSDPGRAGPPHGDTLDDVDLDEPSYKKSTKAYGAAVYLRDQVVQRNTRTPVPDENPKDMEKWARAMDRLHRLGAVGGDSGYSWDEIRDIIDWVFAHEGEDFSWADVVQSATGLREKIHKIEPQWRRANSDNGGEGDSPWEDPWKEAEK